MNYDFFLKRMVTSKLTIFDLECLQTITGELFVKEVIGACWNSKFAKAPSAHSQLHSTSEYKTRHDLPVQPCSIESQPRPGLHQKCGQ